MKTTTNNITKIILGNHTGSVVVLGILLTFGGLNQLRATVSGDGTIPTTLTDRIYEGSGSINLLKDVSAANLQNYLTSGGTMILGADLNESAAGNEIRDSVGVAIKQMQLIITTTAGTFTFGDFWTSSTAMIREAGSATASEFYTLFGRNGSGTINGGTTGFSVENFDDVLEIRNIAFSGTILSAKLNVNFVTTASTRVQGNETFFDYSGGFEDFALIGNKEAYALQTQGSGLSTLSSSVAYTRQTVAAPGAPAPPMLLLAGLGGLVAWKYRRQKIPSV